MDPLNDLIDLLQPAAVALKAIEASGIWGLRFAKNPDVNFGIVLQGSCLLVQGEGSETWIGVGDFLMQSGPDTYTLLGSSGAPVQDAEPLLAAAKDQVIRVGDDSEGTTRILAGHFDFDRANHDLLIGLLPRCIHIPASKSPATRISSLLAFTAEEASVQRPAGMAILKRCIEVILIEVLREAPSLVGANQHGMIAGLQSSLLRTALSQLHAAPGRDWTVALLAQTSGTSRTVLADRFRRVIGVSPMKYLLTWRMALAKIALRRGSRSLEEVAAEVGYKSASAFSTAFSQHVGCSPSSFRKQMRS